MVKSNGLNMLLTAFVMSTSSSRDTEHAFQSTYTRRYGDK